MIWNFNVFLNKTVKKTIFIAITSQHLPAQS